MENVDWRVGNNVRYPCIASMHERVHRREQVADGEAVCQRSLRFASFY